MAVNRKRGASSGRTSQGAGTRGGARDAKASQGHGRGNQERGRRACASGGQRTAQAPRASQASRSGQAPQRAHVAASNLIEGRRAAAEAVRSGFPIKRALVAEGLSSDASLQGLLADLSRARVPVTTVARVRLDELSSHGAHQGIVLETGRFPYADVTDVIARAGDGPALVLVLDHVTDAGNFGAIVRSAEVVGAAGVVIANKRAAEVTVATYKTSAGAVMHLPIARVPNIARALDDLKQAGFWTVGASEHAAGTCWDTPLSGRIALVMGSEGEGISRLVLETCDDLVKLPQLGKTESLNVAQATTALCYEWLRSNWESKAPSMVSEGEVRHG